MIGRKKRLLTVVAVVVIAWGLAGCRHTPDEAQVREAIEAVATAVEAGSASDVVAPLVDDFDGNGGELDRRKLAGMVHLLALRGEHVGVTMGPVSIEHRGDRMIASFTVTLASGGKLIPDQLGIYKVESAWREVRGEWRCYSASWTDSI